MQGASIRVLRRDVSRSTSTWCSDSGKDLGVPDACWHKMFAFDFQVRVALVDQENGRRLVMSCGASRRNCCVPFFQHDFLWTNYEARLSATSQSHACGAGWPCLPGLSWQARTMTDVKDVKTPFALETCLSRQLLAGSDPTAAISETALWMHLCPTHRCRI